ncbi:MAG: lysoplasmalogenase [Panacagrimonas sp.]
MPSTFPAVFLGAAALSALLAIASEERAAGRHPAFFLLKPLTTLLVLGAAATAPDADPAYRAWICAALVLSMCGDIALMWPGNAAFVTGLGSFLVAHGLFVWAFLVDGGDTLPPMWSAVPVLAGGAFFIWLLPRTGPLRLPVIVYAVALVAMTLVAAARSQVRDDVSGALAAAGALLFLFSDSSLAVRQFHGPYPRAQALILSTYWLAIAGVATSVIGSIRVA